MLQTTHPIDKKYYLEKNLSPNQFEGNFLQPTIWQLKRPSTYTFSHVTFLMSHVIYLNNTHG